MKKKNLLNSIFSPIDFLLGTHKVVGVNPTIPPVRQAEIKSAITVFEYNNEWVKETELKEVEACFPYKVTNAVTWINVAGLKKEEVEKLCTHFEIHPLLIEDILSIGQRAKMDDINGLLFCLLNMLYFNDSQNQMESEQLSLILGKNFVISFQEDNSRDVFESLRGKLEMPNSKVRQNKADFLFYALIDLVVDHYFIVMEKLGNKIENVEELIVLYPNTRSLAKINNLRKEMILLKRNVAPVRELVSGILRSESDLIENRTEKYFKDVYDHIVQATDLSDNYRDMMMNLHDLYINNVNLKMNEVMKVMAVVTCLLAPATVIGGIFGMNFERIPLLHNKWGFYISVALMLLVPVMMVRMFRKRGWF